MDVSQQLRKLVCAHHPEEDRDGNIPADSCTLWRVSFLSEMMKTLTSFCPKGVRPETVALVSTKSWLAERGPGTYFERLKCNFAVRCGGRPNPREPKKQKRLTSWLETKSWASGLIEDAENASCQARLAVVGLLAHLMRTCGGFRNTDLTGETWRKSLNEFQLKYFWLYHFGLANRWTKFHFPAIFSLAADQPLPPPFEGELPGCFLSGVGYCFIRYIVRQGPEVCSPFLKLKGGMPTVHPALLHKAKADAYDVLGTRHRVTLETAECPMVNFDEKGNLITIPRRVPLRITTTEQYRGLDYVDKLQVLCEEVKRTCREVFSTRDRPIKVLLPSTSAHFESGRKSGGALGTIGDSLQQFEEVGDADLRAFCRLPPVERPMTFDMWKLSEHKSWLASEISYSSTQDVHPSKIQFIADEDGILTRSKCWFSRSLSRVEQSQYEHIGQGTAGLPVYRALRAVLRNKLAKITDPYQARLPNNVSVVVLPEPDKTRVITTGPADRYWLARGIQKVTHEALRNHPTFRLIGEPLTEAHLARLRRSDEESYLSGDYKSATDLLHPDLSRAAVRQISECCGWGEELMRFYEEGLVGATIAGSKDVNRPDTPQVWGQLMGSPLSFPILCIVNAAMNRFVIELSQGGLRQRMGLKDCPLLINGDDVAAVLHDTCYPFWNEVVADGGLIPSVGKNYFSKEFVIINSTYFRARNTMLEGEVLQKVPCLKTGLLCYQKGSKFQVQEAGKVVSLDPTVNDLAQISHVLCEGFSYEESDHLMRQFISGRDVRDILKGVPDKVSYFADKALGGVGIKRTRDGLLTPEQRGYYTRIAGAYGSLAPTFPDLNSYDASKSVALAQYATSPKSIWSDWFLKSDQGGEMFRNTWGLNGNDLWEALHAMSTEYHSSECTASDYIYSLAQEGKWGASALYSPNVEQSLFKRHVNPWPEWNLCNFPWQRHEVTVSSKQELEHVVVHDTVQWTEPRQADLSYRQAWHEDFARQNLFSTYGLEADAALREASDAILAKSHLLWKTDAALREESDAILAESHFLWE